MWNRTRSELRNWSTFNPNILFDDPASVQKFPLLLCHLSFRLEIPSSEAAIVELDLHFQTNFDPSSTGRCLLNCNMSPGCMLRIGSSNLRPKLHGQEMRASQSMYYLTSLLIHWYHVGLGPIPFSQSLSILTRWKGENVTNHLAFILCIHQREMFVSGQLHSLHSLLYLRAGGSACPWARCPVSSPFLPRRWADTVGARLHPRIFYQAPAGLFVGRIALRIHFDK